jgi:hypothetical protein
VRFRIEQRIPASVDEVEGALLDPAFLDEMARLPRLGRPELLAHEVDGDIVEREIRYRFAGHLSPAVTAVIDPDRLTWVEESQTDRSTHVTSWVIRPDHYADRLRCSGTFTLAADGDATLRAAEGELKVSFPLVGGRVERAIVSGMEEHAQAEAAALAEWLESH